MKLCDYGCGQEAHYQFKNGNHCCNKSQNSCPIIKEKNRTSLLGKNKGKKRSSFTRNQMSKSKLGLQKGKLSPTWRGGYNKRNIPRYNQYYHQLNPIEKAKRNISDKNILEVVCTYCGNWYIPKLYTVIDRIRSINSIGFGEHRFYCSEKCKKECSIYNQRLYPKDHKAETSREVQPELRQLRFRIDNYTCQRCNKHQSKLDVGLHCHHVEGILWEPLESADVDKTITFCVDCHKKVHKIEGCSYDDLKCKPFNS